MDMNGKLHLSSCDMCIKMGIISDTMNILCVNRNVSGKLGTKCLQLFPFLYWVWYSHVNWEVLGKKENLAVLTYSVQKGQKRKKSLICFLLPLVKAKIRNSYFDGTSQNMEIMCFFCICSFICLSMKGFLGSILPQHWFQGSSDTFH